MMNHPGKLNRPNPDDETDDPNDRQLEALHQAISDGGSSIGSGLSELAKLVAETPGGKALELIERVRQAERDRDSARTETQDAAVGSTLGPDVQRLVLPLGADGDPSAEATPVSIGRFQVRRQLGQGGFGLVLLAFDPQLDREIALKIPQFKTLADSATRARFLREGRAAASLNHVNIAAVHEAGNIGSISYIASAYCAGGSLADLLRERQARSLGLLEIRSATTLVAALADAVQHAHSRGVVHRDLKPSNILFEYDPATDHPNGELARAARIVDFGLAKTHDTDVDQTRSGAMLGTLGYMSPEQAAGDRDSIGPAADIYSLGTILYELLTGSPPLRKASDLETMLAIQNDEPAAPRKSRPDCPADLQAICLRCLEKSLTSRYRSATELASDLRRFLAGETVDARPISSRERLARWCRRNPVIAILSAAVVLLAIGASIASIALAQSRSETLRHLAAANSAKIESMRKARAANAAHARSVRRTGLMGQRVESLRAIAAAMEHADQLQVSDDLRLELRNEAIASLSLIDLEIDQQWPAVTNEDSYPATSDDGQFYVRVEGQALSICDLQDNSVKHQLELDEPTDRYIGYMFSPDNRYFAARYERAAMRERLHVWDLKTGQSLGSIEAGGFGNAADFSHDGGSIVTAGRLNDQVEVYELPSLKNIRTLSLPEQPQTLACHPGKPYFACLVKPYQIEVRHCETGDLTRVLEVGTYAYSLGWSPDGRYLASGFRDGSVAVYDGNTHELDRPLKPIWRNDGHTVMAIHLGWHPDSSMLGTSSMDGITRLWDADTGVPLVAADGLMTCFSDDGNWLCTNRARWKIVGGREHQIVSQPEFRTHRLIRFGVFNRDVVTSQINHWEAYPRGRILLGQNYSGCVIRDLNEEFPLAELQFDAGCLRLTPDGKSLFGYSMAKGLQRLPVEAIEHEDHIAVSIGPPTAVMKRGPGFFAVGSDESVLFQPFFGQSILVQDRDPLKIKKLKPMHRSVMYGDISRDGKYVATATFKGKDVQIHDTRTANLIHKLSAGSACPWFTNDNQLLAVAEIGRYTFWEVGTWKQLHKREVVTRGIWPGSLAFTADSKLVAIEDGSKIRLLNTSRFAPIAEFTVPSGEIIESIRFTPDGNFLVMGGADQNPSHIWNLSLIRKRLSDLSLDWDYEPAVPANQFDSDKPIRLKLILNGLAKLKQ